MFALRIRLFGEKARVIHGFASPCEAATFWCRYRDREGFGASAMESGCGDLVQDGKIVLRVSYNGRLWLPDGSEYAKSTPLNRIGTGSPSAEVPLPSEA